MKRFASVLGAVALGAIIAVCSAHGDAVEKKQVVIETEQTIQIITTTEEGKTIVRAFVNGEEVDPKTLEERAIDEDAGDGRRSIVVRVDTGDRGESDDAFVKRVQGYLQVVLDEEVDLDLSKLRQMLEQHGAKLEGQLLHLKDLDLPQLREYLADLRDGETPFTTRTRTFSVTTAEGSPPPVMIGITMDQISPALAAHLKLDPESVTMIQQIASGLPAETAGLRVFDIIIAANDKTPMGNRHFIDLLRGKEPGETVTLRIIRAGELMNVLVELVSWDDQALSVLADDERTIDAYERLRLLGLDEWPGFSEELRQRLRSALGDELDMRELWRREREKQAREERDRFRDLDRRPMQLTPRTIERAKLSQIEARLEMLEDRLERIEEMLRKLTD